MSSCTRLVVVTLCAGLGLGSSAHAADPAATDPTLVLEHGDPLPGSTVGGGVASLASFELSSTDWAATCFTGLNVELLVREAATPGKGIPDLFVGQVVSGYPVVNILDTPTTNGAGLTSAAVLVDVDFAFTLAYSLGAGAPFIAGMPTELPDYRADSAWADLAGLRQNESGQALLVARIFTGGKQPEILDALVRYDVSPAGDVSDPVVVLVEGGPLPGGTVGNLAFSAESTAFNDAGQALVWAGVLPDVGSGFSALVLDGLPVLVNGAPSPVPGRDWLLAFDEVDVDLANDGQWAALVRLSNGFAGIQAITRNGELLAVEQEPAPGLPGTRLLDLGPPRIAVGGQVLWSARWEDDVATHQGLFLNDQLMVQTGVTSFDGGLVLGVGGSFGVSPGTYDIAPDGSRLLFEANESTLDWKLLEVAVGPWVSQGASLAGTGALPPSLLGEGALEAGSNASLSLAAALPGSTATLVLGVSELGAAFKGGTLCPSPDVLIAGLPVDGAGTLDIAFSVPAGLPSGAELFWQYWVTDAGGPAGFAASNCVRGTLP